MVEGKQGGYVSVESMMNPAGVAIGHICRLAFYLSILLFFYGTLFPFDFDFSRLAWPHTWSHRSVIPYWDFDRGRVSSLPDMASNILLTIPLGFFGLLWREQTKSWQRVLAWGCMGLALALVAEIIQLAIPSRVPSLTDVLNNAMGALIGAALAYPLGPRVLAFFAKAPKDRDGALAWLLFLVLIAVTLGPFDLTVSVSHVKASLKQLLLDPWESHRPISHEWIQMVDCALFGALAGRVVWRQPVPFAQPVWQVVAVLLALPIVLELAQLFVLSHAPSLRDMAMGFVGVSAGMMVCWCWPRSMHPGVGLFLVTSAMLLAGLSPYRFVSWALRADFLWIPMYEYYTRTTTEALYDAGIGIVHFAVFAGLFRASLACSRWTSTLAAVALSGAIEGAQMFVPERSAGVTDMLIAALGGWVGGTIWGALGSPASHTWRKPIRGDCSDSK